MSHFVKHATWRNNDVTKFAHFYTDFTIFRANFVLFFRKFWFQVIMNMEIICLTYYFLPLMERFFFPTRSPGGCLSTFDGHLLRGLKGMPFLTWHLSRRLLGLFETPLISRQPWRLSASVYSLAADLFFILMDILMRLGCWISEISQADFCQDDGGEAFVIFICHKSSMDIKSINVDLREYKCLCRCSKKRKTVFN